MSKEDKTVIDMRNMGFLHIQCQLQLFFQKHPALLTDNLGMCFRPFDDDNEVSSPREPPPQALSEPGVNLSAHRAPVIQPMV